MHRETEIYKVVIKTPKKKKQTCTTENEVCKEGRESLYFLPSGPFRNEIPNKEGESEVLHVVRLKR